MAAGENPHIAALQSLRAALVEERRHSLQIYQSNRLLNAKNAAQAVVEYNAFIDAVDTAITDERRLAGTLDATG